MNRSSIRNRVPDNNKSITIIRSYYDLALFEDISNTSFLDSKKQSDKKIKELESKNDKIHQVLKEKSTIIVPKSIEVKKENATDSKEGKVTQGTAGTAVVVKDYHFEQEHFQKNIKKEEFYIKYDKEYCPLKMHKSFYEYSNEDMHQLSQIQGSVISPQMFEKIIIIWEEDTKFDDIKMSQNHYISLLKEGLKEYFLSEINYEEALKRIFEYWKEKRSQRKRSFLRKFFWRKPLTYTLNENMDFFRPYPKEKRNLRKNKKALPEFLSKMMDLNKQLKSIHEIIKLCKTREKMMLKIYEGNFIELSLILRKEAEIKGVNLQNIPYNVAKYAEDSLKEIALCSKKEKKSTKDEIIQQEEALSLTISGKDIISSYEFASIIAYLVQFYDSNVMPIPIPEDIKKGPEPIQKNQNHIDIYGSRAITLSGLTFFKRTDYVWKSKTSSINSKQNILKKIQAEKEAGKLRELKWERIMKKRMKQFFIKKEKDYNENNSNNRLFDLESHSHSLASSSFKDIKMEGINVLDRLKCVNHVFSKNIQFFNEPDVEVSKLKSDHSQLFEDIKFISKRKK